jgi:hypothetical protein
MEGAQSRPRKDKHGDLISNRQNLPATGAWRHGIRL